MNDMNVIFIQEIGKIQLHYGSYGYKSVGCAVSMLYTYRAVMLCMLPAAMYNIRTYTERADNCS